MSTLTTRLGLTKPATTEQYDVTIVNGNSDKIDAAVGVTPATSTTRPSTQLFDGRAVHESDTDELVIRRGAVWSALGTVAATASRIARRGATGTLKVATAAADDDATTLKQVTDAIAAAVLGVTTLFRIQGTNTAKGKVMTEVASAVFQNSNFVNVAIDYTAAAFATPPVVFATCDDAASQGTITLHTIARTTTGCTIVARTTAGNAIPPANPVPVVWAAIGR